MSGFIGRWGKTRKRNAVMHESSWWEDEKCLIFNIVRISTTYTCTICVKISNTGLASSICKCLCRLPSLLAGAFHGAKGGLEWRGGAEREKREGALPASVEEGASVGRRRGNGRTERGLGVVTHFDAGEGKGRVNELLRETRSTNGREKGKLGRGLAAASLLAFGHEQRRGSAGESRTRCWAIIGPVWRENEGEPVFCFSNLESELLHWMIWQESCFFISNQAVVNLKLKQTQHHAEKSLPPFLLLLFLCCQEEPRELLS